MEKDKTKMFMAHIPLKDISNVVSTLLEYSSVGNYLVCGETTPYEHIHYLVEMSDKDYNAYVKRVFMKRHKLRGRASKDKPRQYGKVKEIKDLEKAISYTLKNQSAWVDPESKLDTLYTNMDMNVVVDYLEKSYKKEEVDKLFECMKNTLPDIHCTEYQYEKIITGEEFMTGYGHENEFYENLKKWPYKQGITLGQTHKLRLNLRFYMAKIFDTIGPVKNMRQRFLKACLDLKYITTADYVEIVYRL